MASRSIVYRYVANAIVLGLGALFLVSSIYKLKHPISFYEAVLGYSIVGENVSLLISTIIPWLELIIAISLLLRLHTASAIMLSFALFSVFACAQGYALYYDLTIDCGCLVGIASGNAESSDLVSMYTFMRSGGLAAISLCVIMLRKGIDEPPDRYDNSQLA